MWEYNVCYVRNMNLANENKNLHMFLKLEQAWVRTIILLAPNLISNWVTMPRCIVMLFIYIYFFTLRIYKYIQSFKTAIKVCNK